IVMDALVDLTFNPPADGILRPDDELCSQPGKSPMSPRTLRASHTQSANRLLYGASVVLPMTGHWQLRARIRRESNEANVVCALPVSAPLGRLARLWPYWAMPPFAVALFAMNQGLRRRALHVRSCPDRHFLEPGR